MLSILTNEPAIPTGLAISAISTRYILTSILVHTLTCIFIVHLCFRAYICMWQIMTLTNKCFELQNQDQLL